MRELFPGIPDEQLPQEARRRFFCKFHQDSLGVICERKQNCDKCGWNPAVAKRRTKIIKERMNQE